jgi:hypothetical protein
MGLHLPPIVDVDSLIGDYGPEIDSRLANYVDSARQFTDIEKQFNDKPADDPLKVGLGQWRDRLKDRRNRDRDNARVRIDQFGEAAFRTVYERFLAALVSAEEPLRKAGAELPADYHDPRQDPWFHPGTVPVTTAEYLDSAIVDPAALRMPEATLSALSPALRELVERDLARWCRGYDEKMRANDPNWTALSPTTHFQVQEGASWKARNDAYSLWLKYLGDKANAPGRTARDYGLLGRVGLFFTNTQYAQWLWKMVRFDLGKDNNSRPIANLLCDQRRQRCSLDIHAAHELLSTIAVQAIDHDGDDLERLRVVALGLGESAADLCEAQAIGQVLAGRFRQQSLLQSRS